MKSIPLERPSVPELSAQELAFYRVLGVLSPFLIIGLGVIHRVVNPTVVDPELERLGVAAYILGVTALSWRITSVRFRWLVYTVFLVVTFWLTHLLVINQMSPEYSFSLLVVIPAISALFKDRRLLLAYLALTMVAVAVAAIFVTRPAVVSASPPLYLTQVGLTAILSFIVVGARIRVENDLRVSDERYSLAGQGSRDGLWDLDLRADRLHVSDRWLSMAGLDEGTPLTLPQWMAMVHPDDLDAFRYHFSGRNSRDRTHFEVEYRLLRRNGSYHWMLCRGVVVRDGAGKPIRMAGSQTDIHQRKKVEQQLLHDALHDALTRLPNRSLFLDRVEARLSALERHPDRHFAVLFLDLDRFKVVNDSLGHSAGDQLLMEAAERLNRVVRGGDTVARLGGDEFAVLVDEVESADGAIRVAERMLAEIRLPFEVERRTTYVSASIGICVSTTGYRHPEDMLRDADNAMYRAKERNPGTYEIFDAEMHRDALAILTLEADLRHALEHDEFVVHYQPIVRVSDRRVAGFEALVRWDHPERGLLPPGEFIARAEETGLILALGDRVLELALQFLNDLDARGTTAAQGDPPLYVTVNLSAQQFLQSDLSERIERALAAADVDPSRLVLEVTETVVMRNAEAARETLERLSALGVQSSIDDFGTGYSSLSYLHEFPFGVMKIDQSFVERLDRDIRTEALVRTMIGLADSLDMRIVAEGVERDGQLQRIEALGCEAVQGYFFTKPLPTAELFALLDTNANRFEESSAGGVPKG